MESGTRLGPYEVLEKLGAGGMGDVWRARDARLDRDVAIKVLPASVGDDGDRLARFEREAKAVAALNHPNIAQVYGLETAPGDAGDGTSAADVIVMELVEGEDLSERIARQPIELQEALLLARQIAEALEAAHRAGVVHRDLKPANVRVRTDGVVKVLDFGLAKIVEPDTADANRDKSPTLTMRATQAGLILGTAAYMSPEQARGRAVDNRTDIWAFGCVLFEMLSGRPAFDGEDVSMTLASVLKRDLDWRLLPESTPAPLRRLLERCLTTDVRRRYQAIGDVRIEVEDWIEHGFAPARAAGPDGAESSAGTSPGLLPLAATAVILVVGGALVGRGIAPSSGPPPPTRFSIASESQGPVAFSPDGNSLVISHPDGGLRIRTRASEEFRPLVGAEHADANLAFSPDGEQIAYFVGDLIRRVPATGGTSALVTTTALGFQFCGALTWGRNGEIVFQCSDSGGLWVVPAAGGEPSRLTEAPRRGSRHGAPSFLPDGRTVLFAIMSEDTADDYELAAVSLDTGEPRLLGVTGVQPFYVEPGYVLFAREGAVWGAPFDAASLEFQAEPIPLLEGLVEMGISFGSARFNVSPTGSVAYWSGSGYRSPPRYPSVVDRSGATIIDFPDEISARRVRFSPDNRRIAFNQRDELAAGSATTVRVADLARGAVSRLAEGELADWTPSGDVGYVFRDGTDYALYEVPWDLASPAERVSMLPRYTDQVSWLPQGRGFVLASRLATVPVGPRDLFVGSVDGTIQSWLTTERDEQDPQLSPDGSWIAYAATEPGSTRPQIFIQPFPGPGGQFQVSVETGFAPRWAGDGRRIFFLSEGAIYEVALELADVPTMGTPARLFDGPGGAGLAAGYFDAASDGDSFVFTVPLVDLEPSVLHVAYDWLSEVEAMFDGR
jgi:serine/threonine protein kinase/Tol biopolymer transport system component